MLSLRPLCALVVVGLVIPSLGADDKAATNPWIVDRSLTVSPHAAPTPAFKHRLIPVSADLKEGNAAPIYLRLIHEQSDTAKKYWFDTPKPWLAMPVDKMPLVEAHQYLDRFRPILQQFEAGARRRTVDWSYTFDLGDPIGMLLPDVPVMRNYGPMLALQARLAVAEKDYPAAMHHLVTGIAFSRHVSEGPTLIHKLIGVALFMQFADVVADLAERPDAPNLYWALTALPSPFIDLRSGLDMEYHLLEMQFPELGDLARERTAEQWDAVLRRVRTEAARIADQTREVKADLGLKDCGPADPASKSPDLPAARQFVARTRGLSAAQSEALPAAQALLLYMAGAYHEVRDELYRSSYVSFPRAVPLLDLSHKRRTAKTCSEGEWIARLLLPNMGRVIARHMTLDRNVAALRIVEALRHYAAAHDGKLPDKLDDITEVPIPLDPGTGKPFAYSREQDTVTIEGPNHEPPAAGRPSANGVRYRVTMRPK